MKEPNEMSLPELVELLHLTADEIQVRMMQEAGEADADGHCGCFDSGHGDRGDHDGDPGGRPGG